MSQCLCVVAAPLSMSPLSLPPVLPSVLLLSLRSICRCVVAAAAAAAECCSCCCCTALLLLSLLLPLLRCVLLLRSQYELCAMLNQCMPWINHDMGRAMAMPAVPCSLMIRMVSLLCAAIVITNERAQRCR